MMVLMMVVVMTMSVVSVTISFSSSSLFPVLAACFVPAKIIEPRKLPPKPFVSDPGPERGGFGLPAAQMLMLAPIHRLVSLWRRN